MALSHTRSLRRTQDATALIDVLLVLVAMACLGAFLVPGQAPASTLEASTLVVADLRGHALTVIALPGGTSRRVALEGGPHELLRLADGRIAASLEQAGRVALVELATGGVEYIETGGLPHGLALDGEALLVTDRAAGAVRRFAAGTWRELPPTEAGALPHQVALTGETLRGGALLVADAASDRLALGPARSRPQPALTESIAVSHDGARVAVAGAADGRVLIYSLAGEGALDVLVGGRPVRLAFDPAGVTLAAALSASGEVALIDSAGQVRRIKVGGVPDGLAFDARGRVLFVSDIAGGTVSALDVSSGRAIARLEGGATAGALAFFE